MNKRHGNACLEGSRTHVVTRFTLVKQKSGFYFLHLLIRKNFLQLSVKTIMYVNSVYLLSSHTKKSMAWMKCHFQFVYFPARWPALLSLYRGHTLTTVLVLFALKDQCLESSRGWMTGWERRLAWQKPGDESKVVLHRGWGCRSCNASFHAMHFDPNKLTTPLFACYAQLSKCTFLA